MLGVEFRAPLSRRLPERGCKELSGNNFPIWASPTLVNPRTPIVESAKTPNVLSRRMA